MNICLFSFQVVMTVFFISGAKVQKKSHIRKRTRDFFSRKSKVESRKTLQECQLCHNKNIDDADSSSRERTYKGTIIRVWFAYGEVNNQRITNESLTVDGTKPKENHPAPTFKLEVQR